MALREKLLRRAAPLAATGADDCCSAKEGELAHLATRSAQRKVLFVALGINTAMGIVEMSAGVIAGSSALMADSLDMFGDASVYLLSLYALHRSLRWRAGAAMAKGGIVFLFGLWILFEIARRLVVGGTPGFEAMGLVGFAALAANLTCLGLLWRFRTHDINMSSTFECSRNDVIANAGVLAAAAGVWATGAAWPDLIVGFVIAAIFLRSSFTISRAALPQLRSPGAAGRA